MVCVLFENTHEGPDDGAEKSTRTPGSGVPEEAFTVASSGEGNSVPMGARLRRAEGSRRVRVRGREDGSLFDDPDSPVFAVEQQDVPLPVADATPARTPRDREDAH
jgi:hypothetical protein